MSVVSVVSVMSVSPQFQARLKKSPLGCRSD